MVLLPGLGRGGDDFAGLSERLSDAGFRAVAVDLHGVGSSPLLRAGATLHDVAADVAVVIQDHGAPAHLVGHAFGNRVARCLATDHPQLVRSLTLLAAGGLTPANPAVSTALATCLDTDAPVEQRRHAVLLALCGPGGDPDPLLRGWWPHSARALSAAGARTPVRDWWAPPNASVLVVQGTADVVAPPSNGRALAAELGERVRVVEVVDAGHALLVERPDEVADAVLAFLVEQELLTRNS